jgi:hypothetical protein
MEKRKLAVPRIEPGPFSPYPITMLTELSQLPVKMFSLNITLCACFLFTLAGMFDQRCLEHSEEMENNTRLFLRNYKALNKKVKTFGELYFILRLSVM